MGKGKKKKKEAETYWQSRVRRTDALAARIRQITKEWPTDGTEDTDQEADVADAYEAWERDMGALERTHHA